MTGTLWFLAMVVDTVWNDTSGSSTSGNGTPEDGTSTAELTVALLFAALLAAIVGTALPPFRARFHDRFERIHRFGGWAALALLWIQAMLVAHADGRSLVATPAAWALALITFSVALPWLRRAGDWTGALIFHALFAGDDQKEGMRAFLEKRSPRFTGD